MGLFVIILILEPVLILYFAAVNNFTVAFSNYYCNFDSKAPLLNLERRRRRRKPNPPTPLYAATTDKNVEDGDEEEEDDDDDDDDEVNIKPYRNRSLAWTKRYRKLNPYETCRKRVLNFGHRSKEDWDEAMASGQLGSYVPSHPDEMYAPEWVSWDEWLGLMRSYDETRQLAVSVLGCKSLDDYILFVRSNPRRAEGLRIPVRPDLYFKEEWTNEEDFFGISSHPDLKN